MNTKVTSFDHTWRYRWIHAYSSSLCMVCCCRYATIHFNYYMFKMLWTGNFRFVSIALQDVKVLHKYWRMSVRIYTRVSLVIISGKSSITNSQEISQISISGTFRRNIIWFIDMDLMVMLCIIRNLPVSINISLWSLMWNLHSAEWDCLIKQVITSSLIENKEDKFWSLSRFPQRKMPYSSNGNWLAVVVTSSSTRISLAKIFGVNLVWCKTLIWNP
jgi:hypothetical protein